ncbi:undecaprenyldiphospho-muramoylpentapeptide beta-N-acetylglucosaminyltransferase [Spiribacter vilamensis]|uniref:UDP-N-acetylglucosamine--N-acetylmuramyl-(pentapeptide) pyrophosphoryl-undecaprenol N-acetylglucosamine transferase n=1 Tax=Spiribacter vilamensis TaxID=531306 RepID=A0A4Q8CY69_9GAMM|nr:undecaprenyldiphospho-muramoylpentapeptide beta-N-acetylglucosaminyltransferase [Spiribacter vilamensis]RZU97913.1 UDP-N-acetylglucosamine-N-acetylmuramylpentapeptide N-acetylglucosamine transferase [Spiribacter vilamensis]TVO61173.1 undecaprenyldiphospho-muramoylpentapeptide beta-N-acetylglucosaminyltransferase [Spiribacter vilamensis]
MTSRPVLIIAGGTGGHVFPALAVAEVLVRQSIPVIWVGTPAGLEARVVPAAGIELETVTVRGLRGNGLTGWLKAPWMVARALIQTLAVLRRHRPRVVLGMGGYVTGPGGIAARLKRLPLIIHEQNAIAGLTNRMLSRLATQVLTGLDATFPAGGRPTFTGNPVRAAVTALAEETPGRPSQHPRLLVIGGSLGARTLNRVVPAALATLPAAERPEVVHQAGERSLDIARAAYGEAAVEADVQPFIDDMATAYREADLVVCRAGALTVSELAAVGRAAVFVPFPYAVDDHQTANARFLVNAGAARMIPESELTTERLAAVLRELLADRDEREAMARNARQLGRPRAAEQVADICLEAGS